MKTYLTAALIAMTQIPAIEAQVSPEIRPDQRVTFRLKAPGAREVMVNGQFGEALPLVKGEAGLWTGTTDNPVPAGIHEYSFRVDGLRMIDPRNSVIKPQRWPNTSLLHIPESPPTHWDLQDIPHGTLVHHEFYSARVGEWRKLVVYLPPGAQQPEARLPVLYLAHGYSDNHEAWSVSGKAHWILDSLIHSGEAVPMIIVMPESHTLDPEGSQFNDYREANTHAFAKELIEKIIPFIEARYPVIPEPAGRAFAGLSMGGGHAFTVAFQHSGFFRSIGAFSSAPPSPEYIKAAAGQGKLIENLDLFWVACGDKDFLFERNEAAHAAMEQLGIAHTYVVTPDDNHSWPVWRRYLVRFLPMLFKG
jgi:enterochelin esterase-like enzyme